MTVKKYWTTHVPIIDRDVPRSRILKPHYREKLFTQELNLSQGVGPAHYYRPVVLIVRPDDEIAIRPRRDKIHGTTERWSESYLQYMTMKGDAINGFFEEAQQPDAELRLVTPKGKPFKLGYEPTLSPQARK